MCKRYWIGERMNNGKETREYKWNTADVCYAELGNAIVLQAVNDWKSGWKGRQKNPKDHQAEHLMIDSEIFFKSNWYKCLCEYPAKDLMKMLPIMAKKELFEDTKRKWICAYKRAEEFRAKNPTKTNLKNIASSEKRMTEAEEDMRSSWFINLYHTDTEQLLQECKFIAEKEIAEYEENKRKTKAVRAKDKKVYKSVQKCTKMTLV